MEGYIQQLADHIPINDMDIQCVYEEFVKWVQNLDSGYHIMRNDTVVGVSYDIDVFINWLNKNFFSQKNKAKILKKNVLQFDKGNASLYF